MDEIQYYNMKGEPYNPASGDSWFYLNSDGAWWAGNFDFNGGFGSAKIVNIVRYLNSEYYQWMKEPGPGTPDLFNLPAFKAKIVEMAINAGWTPTANPVVESHVGQYPIETPFGTVWKDDTSKKVGDLTVMEFKALLIDVLNETR